MKQGGNLYKKTTIDNYNIQKLYNLGIQENLLIFAAFKL